MEYGLIGERLGHSFSKFIHAELADYDYELVELNKDELQSFILGKGFKGINVTIPYKEAVIPMLDHIDEAAREIGAVNTIVNRDGVLEGYNTDAAGLMALLDKNSISLKGRKVLILGTGGTSKTAWYVAHKLEASEVFKVSRSGNDGALTYEEAYSGHKDAEVIINTTPCGMFPNIDGLAADISGFSRLKAVVDVIYNPLNTSLVISAERAGITACGGLYMLVAQGAYACAHFTGTQTPAECDIDRIFEKMTRQFQNIVLTGMPSSGKSTVGRKLSKRLGMEFADTDELITARIQMPIAEYFAKYGEQSFRKVESEVITEVSGKRGMVIATGGGVVLDPANITALKHNGMIVFIDRPLRSLICTKDRPLSSDPEKLQKLYEVRYPLYTKYADLTIDGDHTVAQNVELIIKGL